MIVGVAPREINGNRLALDHLIQVRRYIKSVRDLSTGVRLNL
jgi:hypothetical protein